MFQTVSPVIDTTVRGLCGRAYPGHPRGCPNIGKRGACPPQAPLFAATYDLEQPVFAIYTRYDLGAHVAAMREAHPQWSERQLYNCLYWQGTARAALGDEIRRFLRQYPHYHVTACPEGMGVNVTATMAAIGVALQWPPREFTIHVALAGIARNVPSPVRPQGVLALEL